MSNYKLNVFMSIVILLVMSLAGFTALTTKNFSAASFLMLIVIFLEMRRRLLD